jgi:hypothetical protein
MVNGKKSGETIDPVSLIATIHHSPFTIHHSPFTIHHSPFTIHHSLFLVPMS